MDDAMRTVLIELLRRAEAGEIVGIEYIALPAPPPQPARQDER